MIKLSRLCRRSPAFPAFQLPFHQRAQQPRRGNDRLALDLKRSGNA
jgi:hypothetical protein